MDEKSYWLGFSMFMGIGPRKFEQLLTHFGSAKEAWHASLMDLELSGIGSKISEDFVVFRKNFSIEGYEELLHVKGIDFFITADSLYPQKLARIKKPPFILYVRGNKEILYSSSEQSESRSPSTSSGLKGSRRTSFARTIMHTIAIV